MAISRQPVSHQGQSIAGQQADNASDSEHEQEECHQPHYAAACKWELPQPKQQLTYVASCRTLHQAACEAMTCQLMQLPVLSPHPQATPPVLVEHGDCLRECQVQSNGPRYSKFIDSNVRVACDDCTGTEVHTLAHQITTDAA